MKQNREAHQDLDLQLEHLFDLCTISMISFRSKSNDSFIQVNSDRSYSCRLAAGRFVFFLSGFF